MVNICFYTDQCCIRGTSVALFDYAYYNESLLCNKSFIATKITGNHDLDSLKRFKNQFMVLECENMSHLNQLMIKHNIDILYTIKYGKKNDILSHLIKTVVHCVFDMSEPHGFVYAAVSNALAKKYNSSLFVPHMIGLLPSTNKENLRNLYNIPKNAIVFGRMGGLDTFNLTFCLQVIKDILLTRNDIYFILVNTPRFIFNSNVIFINKIINNDLKNKFILSCNAHIECGSLGHSFGINIGEFSVNNKPIIAYKPNGFIWNTAHFNILGDKALYYKDYQEFYNILNTFNPKCKIKCI
jgi:hypothetical protein